MNFIESTYDIQTKTCYLTTTDDLDNFQFDDDFYNIDDSLEIERAQWEGHKQRTEEEEVKYVKTQQDLQQVKITKAEAFVDKYQNDKDMMQIVSKYGIEQNRKNNFKTGTKNHKLFTKIVQNDKTIKNASKINNKTNCQKQIKTIYANIIDNACNTKKEFEKRIKTCDARVHFLHSNPLLIIEEDQENKGNAKDYFKLKDEKSNDGIRSRDFFLDSKSGDGIRALSYNMVVRTILEQLDEKDHHLYYATNRYNQILKNINPADVLNYHYIKKRYYQDSQIRKQNNFMQFGQKYKYQLKNNFKGDKNPDQATTESTVKILIQRSKSNSDQKELFSNAFLKSIIEINVEQ